MDPGNPCPACGPGPGGKYRLPSKAASVFGIHPSNARPRVVLDPGQRFVVPLTNQAGDDIAIHGRGQTSPNVQDGVLEVGGAPDAPGRPATFAMAADNLGRPAKLLEAAPCYQPQASNIPPKPRCPPPSGPNTDGECADATSNTQLFRTPLKRWWRSPWPYSAAIRLPSRPWAIMVSAICTAFSAAPLRRLSETHQKARPWGTVGSLRMRLTNTASSPTHSNGVM